MEQEPGPRGSPQVPQGPAGWRAAAAAPPVPTAKVEMSFSSFLPPQDGQAGFADPVTIVSNLWEQSRQAYSKRGMRHLQRRLEA
jgi:hypothetical protein